MADKRRKRVLIEFTENTEAGRVAGERLRVDPMSASSFVDKQKVAKIVSEADDKEEAKAEKAEARAAVKEASATSSGDK